MENLVAAINNLGQRTWVDYIAIFAPVILSVVAVFVSIATAKKQSKIALFEKRYEAYTWISLIMQIGKDLIQIKDENLITLDEKGRARHYFLMFFWWRANFDYHKFPNMNISFKPLWHKKEQYGYQINGVNQHVLISLFTNSAEDIRRSAFLFPRSDQECLGNLADTYENFMFSVVKSCDFDSEDDSYKDKPILFQELEWEASVMEKRRKEFQEVIKKADDKQIITQIQKLLQIEPFLKVWFFNLIHPK